MNHESVGLAKKRTRRSRDSRVSSNWFPGLNRSIIILLLLLSPLLVVLDRQPSVAALLATTTNTQTGTTTRTWTGPVNVSATTTIYITSANPSYFLTTEGTTYTTTGIVAVPVQVLTTVVYPSVSVQYLGPTCGPSGSCTRIFVTQTIYVTQVGVVVVMSPSQVQSLVTTQHVANKSTMVTQTMTPTNGTWAYRTTTDTTITTTWTYTSTWTNVTSVASATPPPLLTWPPLGSICPGNCMLLLPVLLLVVVGVVGFSLARRDRGQHRAPQQTSPAPTFCGKCGAQNLASNEFCVSCGNKLKDFEETSGWRY